MTKFLSKTVYFQSTTKLFEHLRRFVSKNSYLMLFHEINLCQVVNFGLYTVYNKHEMKKIGNHTRKNCKYYCKCSINFAADCKYILN